jgi:glucan phosphoethanolaminetransferase (alkaline phosphatase superfamily)
MSLPNYVIIPSSSGSLSNCVAMRMPSIHKIIGLLIISWIIYLLVAYAIFYFLNKTNPSHRVNYWIILGILILSGFIVGLFLR